MRDQDLIEFIESRDIDMSEGYAVADLLEERFNDRDKYDKFGLVYIAKRSNSPDLKKAVMNVLQSRGRVDETEDEHNMISKFITNMMLDPVSSVSHRAKDLNASRMD
jgi:hypothetical protein